MIGEFDKAKSLDVGALGKKAGEKRWARRPVKVNSDRTAGRTRLPAKPLNTPRRPSDQGPDRLAPLQESHRSCPRPLDHPSTDARAASTPT